MTVTVSKLDTKKTARAVAHGWGDQRTIQPFVHVHEAMQPILPCIDSQYTHQELQSGNTVPVNELGYQKFPRGKGRNNHLLAADDSSLQKVGILSAGESASKRRLRRRELGGKCCGIETNHCQTERDGALSVSDLLRVPRYVVVVLSHSRLRVEVHHSNAKDSLDDLLQNDVAEDVPSRYVIALQNLGGCV